MVDIKEWASTRAEEIKNYLEKHPQIKRYAILADAHKEQYEKPEEIWKHLVFVDAGKGLQMENLMAVCEIMNMKK